MPVSDLLTASTVDAYAVTVDRFVASAAALAALAGVVTGALAVRPAGRGVRWRAPVALVAGAAGIIVGALVVATADGGPGTGNGIVGGYAALALGLIAVLLGGLAVARTRRTA